MLDRHQPEPRNPTLAASVVAAIQGRIDGRSLAPGARLPSVRGLAETMKVFIGEGCLVRVEDFRSVRARQAIDERENLIALLEANPETDDGYKAPIIDKARAEAWRLRATLPRPQWRWTNPCCYSRRPIYIR